MSRIAGHNQTNFLGGVRTESPELRGFFQTCLRLDNYDVSAAGHITRRKGLTEVQDILGLAGKNIIQFVKLGTYNLILLDDGVIYIILSSGIIKPLSCIPLQQSIFKTPDFELTFVDTEAHFSELTSRFNSNDIVRLAEADDIIWAVSSSHFAPYVIYLENNDIRIDPLYFYDAKESKTYDFLRSIPLLPEDVRFPKVSATDLNYSHSLRLIVDKNTDLNTNRARVWLGYNIEYKNDGSPADNAIYPSKVNAHKVALEDFLGKPLFFNVLPDKGAVVKEDIDYDDTGDYSGTALAGLEAVAGVSDFEDTAGVRRRLIKEFLFGRKYCIIPLSTVVGNFTNNESYTDIYKTTDRIPAVTTASFNFDELTAAEPFEFNVPDSATVILTPEKILPQEEGDGERFGLSHTFKRGPSISGWDLSLEGTDDEDQLSIGVFMYTGGNIKLSEYYRFDYGDRNYDDNISLRLNGVEDSNLSDVYLSFRIETRQEGVFEKREFKNSELNDIEDDIEDEVEDEVDDGEFSRGLSSYRSKVFKIVNDILDDEDIDSISAANSVLDDRFYFSMMFHTNPFEDKEFPDTARLGSILFTVTVSDGVNFRLNLEPKNANIINITSLFSSVTKLTFSKGSKALNIASSANNEGTLYTGYTRFSGSSGNLELSYPRIGSSQLATSFNTAPFVTTLKDTDSFKSLVAVGIGYDYDNSKQKFALGFSEAVNVSSLTSISFGSIPITGALSNLQSSIKGGLYIYEWDLANGVNPLTSATRKWFNPATERLDADWEGINFIFSLPGITFEYNKLRENIVFAWGWSRGDYQLDTGEANKVKKIEREGDVLTTLRDTQGLLALGYQLYATETTVKFSPFVLLSKSSTFASYSNLTMVIGSKTYNMEKFDVEGSDEVQQFRLSNANLMDTIFNYLSDLLGNSGNISLTFSTGSISAEYIFSPAIEPETSSTVWADCLIFEIGMPAPVKVNNTRLIGGNNYEKTHTFATRLIEGSLDGFTTGASVGSEDLWMGKKGLIHKSSKDPAIFSNNFIRRLNAKTAEEVRVNFAKFNVDIAALANQPAGSDPVDVSVLDRFLEVKNIDLEDSRSLETALNYVAATHAEALGRIYTTAFLDIQGQTLTPRFISSNSTATGAFIGSNRGLYGLNSQNIRPFLISRQVPKTDMISLNNALVFVSEANKMIKMAYSRERQGYSEEMLGLLQHNFLADVKDLHYNEVEDSYYMLRNNEDYPIFRALNVESRLLETRDSIAGFSTYSFNNLKVLHLIVLDGIVNAVIEKDSEVKLVKFSADKAIDFNTYEWESELWTNRLIFNNLTGAGGATALLGVKKVSLFQENVTAVNIGVGTGSNAALMQPYVVNSPSDIPPFQDLENDIKYNNFMILTHQGKDNLGIIKGFQAMTDTDPGSV